MPRFPRFLTLIRRVRRARAQKPAMPRPVRLVVVRLCLTAFIALAGLLWSLVRLMAGDISGALLVAGIAAMLASAAGASLLERMPR